MEELYDNINMKLVEFKRDLFLNVCKGNKSAGVRARKASLELEKMFKVYRKKSLESAKK